MRIGIICAGDKELIPFAEELKDDFSVEKSCFVFINTTRIFNRTAEM